MASAAARLPDRVSRWDFCPGQQLTDATIRILLGELRAAYLDPRIRARARTLFARLDPFDYEAEIAAVWQWIASADAVRYMRDPLGAEHITTPVRLDEEIDQGTAAEDCESLTLYAATLLASAGIKSLLEGIGWNPARPNELTHLSLQVIHPITKRRISFDSTAAQRYRGSFALGDTLWRPGLPRRLWNLDGEIIDDDRSNDTMRHLSMRDAVFGDINTQGLVDSIGGGLAQILGTAYAPAAPYANLAAGMASGITRAVGNSTSLPGGPGAPLGTSMPGWQTSSAPTYYAPPPPPRKAKGLPSWVVPAAVGVIVTGTVALATMDKRK